jgi:hypothetical protein
MQENSIPSWVISLARISSQILGVPYGPAPKPTPVREIVDAVLIKERADRWDSKAFNPSSLANTCVRKEVLKRLHQEWGDVVPDKAPVELYRRFAAGTAVHDSYQSGLLGKSGKLWGDWKCNSCGAFAVYQTIPEVCSNTVNVVDGETGQVRTFKCSDRLRAGSEWTYAEVKVRSISDDQNYQIRGRADGVLIQDDGWYGLEMKSLTPEMFQGLYRVIGKDAEGEPNGTWTLKPGGQPLPLDGHSFQGSLCTSMLFMDAHLGRIPLDPDKCRGTVILYINRDNFEEKEFIIPLDLGILDYTSGVIESVRMLVDQGNHELAPKKCSNRNIEAAKRCKWRDECFPKKPRKKKKATKKSDE